MKTRGSKIANTTAYFNSQKYHTEICIRLCLTQNKQGSTPHECVLFLSFPFFAIFYQVHSCLQFSVFSFNPNLICCFSKADRRHSDTLSRMCWLCKPHTHFPGVDVYGRGGKRERGISDIASGLLSSAEMKCLLGIRFPCAYLCPLLC